LLQLQLDYTYFYQINHISRNIVKDLALPTRPSDLDTFYAGSFAQPEIGTEIALGKIAASAGDLADLRQPASHNADARSHRVAVTLGSNEFEIEEMIPITAAIMQQQGRVSIVGYDRPRSHHYRNRQRPRLGQHGVFESRCRPVWYS